MEYANIKHWPGSLTAVCGQASGDEWVLLTPEQVKELQEWRLALKPAERLVRAAKAVLEAATEGMVSDGPEA